jgi:hypothetical protein
VEHNWSGSSGGITGTAAVTDTGGSTKNDDLIGHVHRFIDVTSNDDDRHPKRALHLHRQLFEIGTGLGVDGRERLVHQQTARLERERPFDGCTLLFRRTFPTNNGHRDLPVRLEGVFAASAPLRPARDATQWGLHFLSDSRPPEQCASVFLEYNCQIRRWVVNRSPLIDTSPVADVSLATARSEVGLPVPECPTMHINSRSPMVESRSLSAGRSFRCGSFSAPVVFFCQNNQWAISEPVSVQSPVSIAERGRGFGIPSVRVNGNDVLATLSGPISAIHASSNSSVSYRSPACVSVLPGTATTSVHNAGQPCCSTTHRSVGWPCTENDSWSTEPTE